jgi:hypothetical protein
MLDRRLRFRLVLSSFIALLLAGACSGPTTLQSRSGTQEPAVDGALDEWGRSLAYVDDGSVRMSAEPTDSLLYVAVAIQDRALIRSIAANGLIVWVDPTGKQQRTYGIQYPLGLKRQRPGPNPSGAAASGGNEQSRPALGLDQVSLDQLEIIRHDSTRNRIPAQFSSGLRAKAVLSPGALIYELAIPVADAQGSADSERYGLRKPLRPPVGLGLQIRSEDDQSNRLAPDQGQGVPSVTGRTGRRGGRGRRGRRGRGGRRGQQPQPAPQPKELPTLDLWTEVVSGESN